MTQTENQTQIQVQNEIDTNLLRFMQIREDFYDAVKEIKPNVALLKETNNSLVSHFEVLRQISKNAQDNMQIIIKSAAKDMGHAAAGEFSSRIEETLKGRTKELDRALDNAARVLRETMGKKYLKLVLFSIIGCLLFGVAGFGAGYTYSQSYTHILPNNFLETYVMGLQVKQKRLQEEGKKRAKK